MTSKEANQEDIDKAYKDIIDSLLIGYRGDCLNYECALRIMIRENITPIELFNHIEDLIDWYNEPEEKYTALMNPWFSNRLTTDFNPRYEDSWNTFFGDK